MGSTISFDLDKANFGAIRTEDRAVGQNLAVLNPMASQHNELPNRCGVSLVRGDRPMYRASELAVAVRGRASFLLDA